MALKINFNDIEIKRPSGSGISNSPCKHCGAEESVAYSFGYGELSNDWWLCMQCGSDQHGGFDTDKRDRMIARHERNVRFFQSMIDSWKDKS